MRRSELVRALAAVPAFDHARPELEQVVTPPEAAATLLQRAAAAEGLEGRSVLDLGCGTGRLAIGAALLGAAPVSGVDVDPAAIALARRAAEAAGVTVRLDVAEVARLRRRAEVVVMNPPFGAQRAHADRPFWDQAFACAERAIYAYALSESRTFIARRAVERGAHVVSVEPVPWVLPRSFPHHTRRQVPLGVDLWAIRTHPDP